MRLAPDLERWLTDRTDPSVRLRAYSELLERPEADREVVEARAEIGHTGWAAGILAEQRPDGQWTLPYNDANDLYWPLHTATIWQLIVLSDLGATKSDPRVDRAARLFLDRFAGALGGAENPIKEGPRGKLCVTGNVVRMMHRFGFRDDPRIHRSIQWLMDTQLGDGGWNCNPSARSGNLDDWEALGAFSTLSKEERSPEINRAIARGIEFYLQRKLMVEGDRYEPWFRLHYPVHYYYDLLLGLDVITRLGCTDDPRLAPALDWLESRRGADGRWPLDRWHPDEQSETVDSDDAVEDHTLALEPAGAPSRWITITALCVLHRTGRL